MASRRESGLDEARVRNYTRARGRLPGAPRGLSNAGHATAGNSEQRRRLAQATQDKRRRRETDATASALEKLAQVATSSAHTHTHTY